MKNKALILIFAFLFFAPYLCEAKDDWKIYPYYYSNDTIETINALAPLPDGGILFSPWTKLRIIKDDSLSRVENPYINSEYFEIHIMGADTKGTVWINTLGGLAKYTKEGGFEKVSKLDYGGAWDYGSLNGLTVDNNDNVWFFSDTQYLTKFDGEKFTDYVIGIEESPYFPMFRITSKDSTIIYDCPKGIVEVTVNTQDSLSYKITPLSAAKLNGRVMRCMRFDDFGNLYAASDTNDLSIFSNGKWEAINIPDSLKYHSPSWKDKFINRIVPIGDGQIYVFWRTHNFFCKYDRKTDKWEKINFPFEVNDTLKAVLVGSATFDSQGYLWISTYYQGLLRYKLEEQSVEDSHIFDAWIEDLYPNPTRGNILKAKVFLMPDGVDNVEAYVSDIFGNRLIDFSNNFTINPSTGEANLECSLEGLANGAYIFVLKKGPAVRAKNFVKID